jgi:CheY-like chemotaxis protein
MMSHEVRTPISAIVGFANLMLETNLAPEQRDYAQTILRSGEALIQLTSDILDFSRLESGALKLEPRAAVLRDCVEDALDLLAIQAAEKKLELIHWVEDDVPAVAIVDAARLRQVLVNLISNAVKFTEEGAVEVTLRCEAPQEKDSPDEKRLAFAVRDTGVGISPERQEALFKAFGPVGAQGAGRLAGAGLGLAISQRLVRLMGGEIGAVSEPGKGSVFSFAIPVSSVSDFARHSAELQGFSVALSASSAPLRGEFQRLARRWGVTLVEVGAPGELDGRDWDAAFVDVDAPTAARLAEGTGLPARLKTDAVYALVPVSLVGGARAKIREHFFRLINKPVHHEGLLALLTGVRQAPPPEKGPGRDFGFNVLVVEDNLVNQRLITRLLGMMGCKAAVADNGRLALDKLAASGAAYDLILMDLHMPELDGLGAIEKIRAGEAGPDARDLWITVLTVDARRDQRERAVAAGANDYLLKPVGMPELAESLRRFAQGRPS